MPRFSLLLRLTLASAVVACGGDSSRTSPSTPAATPPSTAAVVAPTGRVITIDMVSDEKGNYFSPAKLEARRGDVLRFVLQSGVHNVHFLPDSNPGKSGLPPASDLFQIPGQTWDLTVALPGGHYVFQCDPHAALGMIAKLEVEDEKD